MDTIQEITKTWRGYRRAIFITFVLAVLCGLAGREGMGLAALFAALNAWYVFGLIIHILWDCGLAVLEMRDEMMRQADAAKPKRSIAEILGVPARDDSPQPQPPRPKMVSNAPSSRAVMPPPKADPVPCPHCSTLLDLPGPGIYSCPSCKGQINAK